MLRRLSWEDKLHVAHHDFTEQGMMDGSTSSYMVMIQAGGTPTIHVCETEEELHDDEDLGPASGPKVLSSIELVKRTGACTVASSSTDIPDYFPTEPGYPDSLIQLAEHIQQPQFPVALCQFLWQQLHPDSDLPAHTIPISDCPDLHRKLKSSPFCNCPVLRTKQYLWCRGDVL